MQEVLPVEVFAPSPFFPGGQGLPISNEQDLAFAGFILKGEGRFLQFDQVYGDAGGSFQVQTQFQETVQIAGSGDGTSRS